MPRPTIDPARERALALELGLQTYWSGKRCGRGHLSKRYSKDRSCVACKAEDSKSPKGRKRRRELWRESSRRYRAKQRKAEAYSRRCASIRASLMLGVERRA
jgi:hypothetical protein